jgi:hypothetical protein
MSALGENRERPSRPNGKLTPENVAEIRRSTMSHAELALKFRVCKRTIFRTVTFESWKSIG